MLADAAGAEAAADVALVEALCALADAAEVEADAALVEALVALALALAADALAEPLADALPDPDEPDDVHPTAITSVHAHTDAKTIDLIT